LHQIAGTLWLASGRSGPPILSIAFVKWIILVRQVLAQLQAEIPSPSMIPSRG